MTARGPLVAIGLGTHLLGGRGGGSLAGRCAMRARHRRALHGLLKLAGGAILGGLLAYLGTPTETAVYIMLVVVAVTALVAIVAEGSGALLKSELALSTAVLLCSGLVIGLFVAG